MYLDTTSSFSKVTFFLNLYKIKRTISEKTCVPLARVDYVCCTVKVGWHMSHEWNAMLLECALDGQTGACSVNVTLTFTPCSEITRVVKMKIKI